MASILQPVAPSSLECDNMFLLHYRYQQIHFKVGFKQVWKLLLPRKENFPSKSQPFTLEIILINFSCSYNKHLFFSPIVSESAYLWEERDKEMYRS